MNTEVLKLIEKHSKIGGNIFNMLDTVKLNEDLLKLKKSIQPPLDSEENTLDDDDDWMKNIEVIVL